MWRIDIVGPLWIFKDFLTMSYVIKSLRVAEFTTDRVQIGPGCLYCYKVIRIKLKSVKYSRLSLSRSRRDPLKHFEISVLRHIRCVELRKMSTEQPDFTNEHVI